MDKLCSSCYITKEVSEFHKCSRSKSGLKSTCKLCRKEKASKRYVENKCYIDLKNKEYYENNKNKLRLTRKKYYEKNKGYLTEKASEWARNNRDRKNVHKTKRRCLVQNACPNWSESDKIKKVYEKAKWLESLTGIKYHVDHIIPINNPNVCGLHVWNNLQILSSDLNFSKNNKFEVARG